MSVAHIEVLVEERSMEAALRVFLPRVVGRLTFQIHPFRGKDDLMAKLPKRLRGYGMWLPEDWRVVVLVDRDDDDCLCLKLHLETIAWEAGLQTRGASLDGRYAVATRLAIEELEAWYFGDWIAVRAAYPRVPEGVPRKAAFRDPDSIGDTWEQFEKVLQRARYFTGGLRKIEAARAIAAHWDPDRNVSESFRAFRAVLGEMTA